MAARAASSVLKCVLHQKYTNIRNQGDENKECQKRKQSKTKPHSAHSTEWRRHIFAAGYYDNDDNSEKGMTSLFHPILWANTLSNG